MKQSKFEELKEKAKNAKQEPRDDHQLLLSTFTCSNHYWLLRAKLA